MRPFAVLLLVSVLAAHEQISIRNSNDPDNLSASSNFTYESGFSGPATINNGDSVTITSSSQFGTKPNGAKAKYFWELDTNTNLHALSRESTFTRGMGGSISTAQHPVNATGAIRLDINASNDAVGPGGGTVGSGSPGQRGVPVDSDNIYIYFKRYADFLYSGACSDCSNIKQARLWNAGQRTSCILSGIAYGNGESSEGDPRQSCSDSITDSPYFRQPGSGLHGLDAQQWVTDEVFHQQDTAAGAKNGKFHHFRNARLAFSLSTDWGMRIPGDAGGRYNLLYFATEHRPGFANPQYWYLSTVYVDDSWASIMVSTETSYNTATRAAAGPQYAREIQLPTNWTPSSITFTVRQGSHASLSGKVLYVIPTMGPSGPLKIGTWN